MHREFYNKIETFLSSFTEEDKNIFLQQLKINVDLAEHPDTAESLLQFGKSKKKLKLTEAPIPKGVLPKNSKGYLTDVRIQSRGPDDKIYNDNKDFREKITRGLTFLELTRNNKSLPLDLVIYANKKFSGGTGDDDDFLPDDDSSWKKFFLEAPEEACRIVSCKKLNGEAGHFSGRYIEEIFYYFIGSKNVHMMVKSIDEVRLYDDQRYSIARVVATAVLTAVKKLAAHSRSLLKTFLHRTKATIVCEVLQPEYQHIVNLSYLSEPVVEVVMITSTASEEDSVTMTAFSPHLALQYCELLGFTVAECGIVTSDKLQEEILKIRKLEGVEGSVLYFLNNENNTIGLCKVKTYWYVLLRALREKSVHGFASREPLTVNEIVKKTKKRFKEIQNWLKFEDSVLLMWQDTAESFLKWMDQQIKLKKYEIGDIRPKYPIIWSKFQERKQ